MNRIWWRRSLVHKSGFCRVGVLQGLRIVSRACVASFGFLLLSTPMPAQQRNRTLTVAVGPSLYDFGGADEESRLSGVGFVFAARLDHALAETVIAEVSVGYFEYRHERERGPVRSLLPEVNVQYARANGVVRPYIGIGGGLDVRLQHGTAGTVHAVLGTRVALAPRWNVRAEVRGRVLVPFSAWADLTLGAERTF